MAHGAVLRSPHAHEKIVAIDVAKAAKLPGVVIVVTGRDLLEVTTGALSFASPAIPQLCIATDKVRHVGEIVAAVVADDRYVAEDAVDLIEVEYEPLPVINDMDAALAATGEGIIHP